MKKSLALILFTLVMCHTLIAGNPGSGVMFVTGTVTDKSSNETLAGVEVRVKGTNIVTYTNFDGNFFLPELPAGTYILEFNCITYSTTSIVTDGTDAEPELSVAMQQR
jgi:hypothetical protein